MTGFLKPCLKTHGGNEWWAVWLIVARLYTGVPRLVFLLFSACSGRSWAVWQTDQERSECALNHKITAKSQLLIFFAEKVPVYYISFPNPNEGHITEWLRMSISIMLQDAKSTGIAGGGKPIHCGNINTTISQTLHLISLTSSPLSFSWGHGWYIQIYLFTVYFDICHWFDWKQMFRQGSRQQEI